MSTSRYLQGNGHLEAASKTIMNSLKKRFTNMDDGSTNPRVLFAYRFSPRRPTGETSFFLVHGVESIMPLEYEIQKIRTRYAHENEHANNQALHDSLDFIYEKKRTSACQNVTISTKHCPILLQNLHPQNFDIGDLILRKVFQNTLKPSPGSLA